MTNPYLAEYHHISEDLISSIQTVLESGQYILGSNVKLFETSFAEYVGASHAVGVANGLDALYIILRTLGIGSGDEVITTALSAVATTLAITQAGATPVFVDIDEFYHLNADQIEQAITKKTKAIIPVHLYGQPADVLRIKHICETYKIHLIEDCAQAHGAKVNDTHVGTFGEAGAFPFILQKTWEPTAMPELLSPTTKKLQSRHPCCATTGKKQDTYMKLTGSTVVWTNSRLQSCDLNYPYWMPVIRNEQFLRIDTTNPFKI